MIFSEKKETIEAHEQAPGLLYTTVAREWRCKVNERDTLGKAQQAWELCKEETKAVPGVTRVSRLACGTCLDFKIVVSLPAESYKPWAETGHPPETKFLEALRAIPGVSAVEAQLFSISDE